MNDERARELLARERERIERELATLRPDDVDDPDEGDVGEGSESLYQDEFDAGRAEDLRGQLEAVERAEARLAAGTYGRSVESGEPIPDARLESVPTAELTLAEEERRRGV